jgi:hypothetical protein
LALTCGALCGVTSSAVAESVSDHAVRVSATVQTNPPQIGLSWPADPAATGYKVYRKLRDDSSWGAATLLAANATNYPDSNVAVGSAYEYEVSKSATTYGGVGYIYAGIQVPLVDSRGKVVLVVDNTFSLSLANELARLTLDLAGDGWTVLRHDMPRMAVNPANTSSNVWVARSNELTCLKALIRADYSADTNNVKALLLLGHVPVPYSGKIAPDDHSNHLGAWPADMYYGDMSGIWTDSIWNTTTASDTRNWNVPGDGKFDQAVLPGTVTLQVGRVDLANLPAFPQGETELLRQYLNKDHGFRHQLVTTQRRGWIDDHFGVSGASAPVAVNGWRNFAPFFGASNSFAGSDWLGTLATNSYLWGYGCGGGTYTSCSGVGSTTDFATHDPEVVFTMFFGSYFGDWDSQNNFMRAALATTNYTLTSAWVGRPYWQFHHMALGETIGFSTRLSQNNDGTLYSVNLDARAPHIALMGDPTLRMHIVAPPSGLLVSTNSSGGLVLSWNASPDTVLGYHVYQGPTAAGPFTRLTSTLLTGTTYTDPLATTNVYMVRAVKLEVSASGSYYNASQGIFQSLDGAAGAPALSLVMPGNNTLFIAPTNILIQASLCDPANGVTNVAFYANSLKVGEVTAPLYSAIWSNPPSGDYVLTARATCSGGFTTNSAPASVRVGSIAPGLALASAGTGTYVLRGAGIPGYTYRIQSATQFGSATWQTIGAAGTDASGTFRFTNSGEAPQHFYRTIYP